MQSKSSELFCIQPETLQCAAMPLRKFSVTEQMTDIFNSMNSHSDSSVNVLSPSSSALDLRAQILYNSLLFNFPGTILQTKVHEFKQLIFENEHFFKLQSNTSFF